MITLEELQAGETAQLTEYIKLTTQGAEPYRHKYYDETVRHAENMGIHVEGFEPYKLLKQKRPNEPEQLRDYRLNNWKPVTKSESDKVTNTVARIMSPKLFSLKFPDDFNGEPKEMPVGEYLTQDYGIYGSIWQYLQETGIKLTFSDANAVCLVKPTNMDDDDTEYYNPMPYIYRSEYVIDFKDGYYYTFYFPEKKKDNKVISAKMHIVTAEYLLYIEIDGENNYTYEFEPHNLGVVPAFRLGGQAEGDYYPYWFSSLIGGVQPHWDKVVTMTSDLDASIVNHLFPERFEWQDECDRCAGKGYIEIEEHVRVGDHYEDRIGKRNCYRCEGAGYVTNKSPFGIYSIKRDAINPDLPSPIPPAGYITKDIEPMKELKVMINDEIYKGFSAINMEVLHKVGADQSGVAKTIDREDLYGFLQRVSNHLFDWVARNIVNLTARWRYSEVLNVEDYIREIKLSKPKEFGALNMEMLMAELKEAGQVSSNYYRQLETELAQRKFSTNEKELKKNLAIIKLKPFPNKSIDQLLSANAINAVRENDVIRNENIDELVTQAIEENDGFLELSQQEQIDFLNTIIDRDYKDDFDPPVPVE